MVRPRGALLPPVPPSCFRPAVGFSPLSGQIVFYFSPHRLPLASRCEALAMAGDGLTRGQFTAQSVRAPNAGQAPPRGRIPLGRRRLRPPALAGGHA
jgi:hypothetical protein